MSLIFAKMSLIILLLRRCYRADIPAVFREKTVYFQGDGEFQ
jgi:hypothetical protein